MEGQKQLGMDVEGVDYVASLKGLQRYLASHLCLSLHPLPHTRCFDRQSRTRNGQAPRAGSCFFWDDNGRCA